MIPNIQDFHLPRRKQSISMQGPHKTIVNSKLSSQDQKNGVCLFLPYKDSKLCTLYDNFFENLFFWDSHQYPNDATWKIWNHNIYYQVSCGYLHKSYTKSTRFVCLVLTGVSVVNFFIRDNLGLIFLHSTHIMFLGSHMNVVLKILVWKKSKFKGFTMKNTYMQYIHMCIVHITYTYYIHKRWAE